MTTDPSAEHDFDPRDVIDAFADREAVDADVLLRALERADGRRYFVDVLTLRRLVREPGPAGSGAAARPVARAGQMTKRWWTIAAAVVCLAATGGYLGGLTTARRSGQSAPPSVAGSGNPAIVVSTTPPSPTHTIRLERGVDWVERFGG